MTLKQIDKVAEFADKCSQASDESLFKIVGFKALSDFGQECKDRVIGELQFRGYSV